jgi:hypothetical protein
MSKKHAKLATALGAKLIAKVASVGPGAFGAGRLQHLVADLCARLQAVRGNGRDARWNPNGPAGQKF